MERPMRPSGRKEEKVDHLPTAFGPKPLKENGHKEAN
jgi:hypothetical protein